VATYTILTVGSAQRLLWLHDRMPVILPNDAAVAAWLGTGDLGGGSKQQVGLTDTLCVC
jgi:putative SOS response-associated peptidase YedK